MPSILKILALVITAGIAPVAAAKSWKGAEFLSQQTFLYGAFEARIQAAPGSGVITPFFLIKENAWLPGQEWQELDFEIFGRSGGTHFQTQVMTPNKLGGPIEHVKEVDTHVVLSQAYHTYRIEWSPVALRFYFDGYLIREETDREEFGKYLVAGRVEPMRLRASAWAGHTNWTGAFDAKAAPSSAYIRYIAYERYTPGQGAGGGDFTPEWQETFATFDHSRWYLANWDFAYAITEYTPANGQIVDNTLTLSVTRENSQGFHATVPADHNVPRGPLPSPVDTAPFGDGSPAEPFGN